MSSNSRLFIIFLFAFHLKKKNFRNSFIQTDIQTGLLNTEALHLKVQLIRSEPTLKPKSTLWSFDRLITLLFDCTYHVTMRALHPDYKSFI